MSKLVPNIIGLLTISLIIACIASDQRSIPERPRKDGIAANVGCGTVNFMVTAYLPQPHATAFCNAYLQKPRQTYTTTATVTALPSAGSATDDVDVPMITAKAYRKAKIPDFTSIRERQRDENSSPSLLEKACGCMALPETTTTVVIVATVTPTPNFKFVVKHQPAEIVALEQELAIREPNSTIVVGVRQSRRNTTLDAADSNGGIGYVGVWKTLL